MTTPGAVPFRAGRTGETPPLAAAAAHLAAWRPSAPAAADLGTRAQPSGQVPVDNVPAVVQGPDDQHSHRLPAFGAI